MQPSGDDNNTILEVQAYDWVVRDQFSDDNHAVIHCWALDKESKAHLLRFNNFPVFCHVELPLFVRSYQYTWKPAAVRQFVSMLSARLGDNAPTRYVYKDSKKLYFYRGERKFPMIQLSFDNLNAMRKCSDLLANAIKTDDWGFIKCNVLEDSISMVRKLLTVRDIKYTQWFRVRAQHVSDEELRISSIQNEYIAEWDTMEAIPEKECETWTTKPGILAFDIECYSDNHRQIPDKYNALHCAYMISCIYQKYQQADTRKRYGIIIGECNHIPEEKLAHCEIIKVKDEIDMVEAFGQVVRDTDPEIITGYNILGFDYPYLDHRIKRKLKEWPVMGRISGERSHMTSKTWASGAYGHQSINILHMEGRISIDMLPVVKREHKLNMYNLDTVTKHFLGKSKHDVTAPEMFTFYENMRNSLTELVQILREGQANPELEQNADYITHRTEAQAAFDRAKAETTRVMEYCIQDSELVIELMEKLNSWVGLVEMSSVVGTTIMDLFTRGQQVRCMSQLYDLAARMGHVIDSRDVPAFTFSGGFVFEPRPGLYENIICLDFASLYPSIIQAYNICYTTLVPPELENVVPDSQCHVIEFDQEEEEGRGAEEDEADELLEEIDEPAVKKRKVTRHYRFKFYKEKEGLLPRLVRELVAKRKAVQAKMRGVKDPIMKGILNARQLAIKVSANSFFGFLGVQRGGKAPLLEGAMSITAKGRELIGMANNHLTTKYADRGAFIVYNDTDSTMVNLGIKDSSECQYWGERLAHEFNGVKKGDPLPAAKNPETDVYTEDHPGLFSHPVLRFEFEKAMLMLCIKKKKYAALLIDKKGNYKMKPIRDSNGEVIGFSDKFDMLLRGIVLARRDNCIFLRNTYMAILDVIMKRRGLEEAIDILVDSIQRLLDGQVPFDELIIIRGLGDNYKSDSYFMKVFADELKRLGKPVNPGDRLDFLIVDRPGVKLLGHKMRLREQYVDGLTSGNPEPIDYNYYIEKALMNPINQLFEVGFKDTIAKLQHVSYRPTNRHKNIYLDRPVQIILKMRERGYDLNLFKQAVRHNVMELNSPTPTSRPLQMVIQSAPPTLQMVVQPPTPTPQMVVQPPTLQMVVQPTPPPARLVLQTIGSKSETPPTRPLSLRVAQPPMVSTPSLTMPTITKTPAPPVPTVSAPNLIMPNIMKTPPIRNPSPPHVTLRVLPSSN